MDKIKNYIKNNKLYIVNFAVMVALLSIYLLAFYPAIMTSDSQDQWNQIMTGSYGNTHPAFYTWMMSLLVLIFKTPAMISIFQIILFSCIWTYGIKTVLNKKTSFKINDWIVSLISTFIVAIFPLNGIFAVTFWKDIIYTYLLLLFLIWIYKFFIRNDEINSKDWIYIIINLILTSTFRHNGIIAALFILIMFGFKYYKQDKNNKNLLIKLCSIYLIIFIFIKIIFVPHILNARPSNPVFSKAPFIHMDGRLIKDKKITNEDDLRFLNDIIPVDKWASLYNNYTHNSIMFSGELDAKKLDENKSKFIKMSVHYILKNPSTIAKHYLELTSIVWSINERDGAHTNAIVNQIYPGDLAEKNNLKTTPISKNLNIKLNTILDKISTTQPLKTVCCRPALYMYLSIIMVVLLTVIFKNKKYLWLLGPTMFNIASILPILTDQDTRYFYITFLAFFFIIFVSIFEIVRNMKEVKAFNKKCIKNGTYKKLFLIIFLLFFDLYTYKNMCASIPDLGMKKRIVFIFFYIFSNLMILYVYKYLKRHNEYPIERKFALIASIIGLFYVVFIPVMSGTDEPLHFYRAYQISAGDMVSSKTDQTLIDGNLLALPYRGFSDNYSSEVVFAKRTHEMVELPYTLSSGYSPLQYIPQVTGFITSNILHLNAFFTVLVVRLFNLFVWIYLMYLAIKIMPYKKTFFALFSLAPASISLAASSSGDIFSTAIGFLLIAYILKLRNEETILTKKDKIRIALMSLVVSVFKTFYGAFLIILFLLKKSNFKSKKERYYSIFALLFVCLVVDYIWLKMSGLNSGTSNPAVKEQLLFVINHPFDYFMILFRTYYEKVYDYAFNFVAGGEMCYGKAIISSLWSILYLVVLVRSYICDDSKYKFDFVEKVIMWLSFLIVFVCVSSVMYISWTPTITGVAGRYIIGVQSRYFVLFVPLLVLTFKKNKIVVKDSNNKILLAATIINVIVLMETVTSVIGYRFYN